LSIAVSPPQAGASAVAVCFTAQLLVALVIIPPWQHPDEPQHVMNVRLHLEWGPRFSYGLADEASERAIVGSMAASGWWRHYQRETPEPVPKSFASGPANVVGTYFGPPGGPQVYYRAVARLFRVAGVGDLLAQLYVMRALSALAGVLTLACAWSAVRQMLDARAAVVVTAALALLPQHVLASTSASPDAAVNLAGAIVWWQSAALITSRTAALPLAWVWIAAIAAFLTRRVGVPLIAIAAGITLTVVVWRMWNGGRAARRAAGTVLAIVVLAAVTRAMLAWDFYYAIDWAEFDLWRAAQTTVANAGRLPAFLWMTFTSFWLRAGWLRYPAPDWWYFLAAAVTATALTGFFRTTNLVATPRRLLLLMATMILVQFAALLVYYFGWVQAGPQGKYLFPMLPPIMTLVWLGWRRWFAAPEHQPTAAVALVAILAFMNVTGWVLVIMPAYS
jgi:hypothetical protein